MTLNLDGSGGNGGALQMLKKPGGLSLGLPLELTTSRASADLVDVELPLDRQGYVYEITIFFMHSCWRVNKICKKLIFIFIRWYHGSITRIEAEAVLRLLREGSYLVRNSESTRQDYSLSLK